MSMMTEIVLQRAQNVRDAEMRRHGLDRENISRRSRRKLLLRWLDGPIRKACLEDSLACIPPKVYDSLKTTIVKCLVYQHDGAIFPHRYTQLFYAAIEQVYDVATSIQGSVSYEQKVDKAIAKCKKDPKWAGHPKGQDAAEATWAS